MAVSRRNPGLEPDTALEIRLHGAAIRHARQQTPHDQAVADLKQITGQRTDLAGNAAGNILGHYIARPTTTWPADLYAAALLVLAGADPNHLSAAFERARAQTLRPSHKNPEQRRSDDKDAQTGQQSYP